MNKKRTFQFWSTLLLLFLFSVNMLKAQGNTVKGRVMDTQKNPLIGVNILLKGARTGTVTNTNGEFSITVNAPKSVLAFSYLGFTTQEVEVRNQTQLVVILEEDSKSLDELVVTGYGSTRRGDLTGAITQLRPNDAEAARTVTLDNLLQGRVAGLTVTSGNALPGGAVSIQIRGANSLRGDNEPLYVIDNIPQSSTANDGGGGAGGNFQVAINPLTNLDPNDIESMEVLKDASATAIYGSRGANGVILITTKKGKVGKAKLNVSVNFTLAEPARYFDLIGMHDYAQYNITRIGLANSRYRFGADNEVRFIPGTISEYNEADPATYHRLEERNWQREIFRQSFSQNYVLNLSGGSERSQYYISGGYKKIEGLVKQTGMQQGNFRINNNLTLSNRVKLNTSFNASIKENDMMSGGDTKGGASGSIVRTALDYAPHFLPAEYWENNRNEENMATVFSWLNDYKDLTTDYTFRGSMELNWEIAPWISYSGRLGGNIRWMDRSAWWGVQLFRGQTNNGLLASSKTTNNNYTVENLLNFKKKWGNILNLTGLVGVTYDQYSSTIASIKATDFPDKSMTIDGLHMALKPEILPPSQSDYQLLSYLGRANLAFLNNRYLLTLSVRADGSSKFAKANRWGYFPSASAAWRVEQESFMRDAHWLDQLKVRAGWGITGNQSIAPYQTLFNYEKGPGYASYDKATQIALIMSGIANPDITWESTSSTNVGFDFSIFKSRLSGTIDLYSKTTDDLLINKDMPPSSGVSKMIVNQGSILNQGVEISLSADIIRTKQFSWKFNGNIGFNNGRITSLGLPETTWGALSKDGDKYSAYLGSTLGDLFGPANIFIKGSEPGLFWGMQTDGIIQTPNDLKYIDENGVEKDMVYKIGTAEVGNYKLVDQDGNGIIDEKDKTIIGTPNAKFVYGFGTEISYRDFSLSAQFNGRYGNMVLNTGAYYNEIPGIGGSTLFKDIYDNAWRGEGTSNIYPKLDADRGKIKGHIFDTFLQDASFLRCSDITLSYNVPKNLLRKVGIASLGLFASVQNPFVITPYRGYDPEVNSFTFDGTRRGIDMNGFPRPRAYVFGLNLSF